MHPRVSLHQVSLPGLDAAATIAAAAGIGIRRVVLASPSLADPAAIAAAKETARRYDVRVAAVCHAFAVHPDLPGDAGGAGDGLTRLVETAALLGVGGLYLLTGGRGRLGWDQAAARFAELVAPAATMARAHGLSLMIENASALYADVHIAHTLADTIVLAEQADIGVCAELFFCWAEGRVEADLRRAMPRIGLVQVSDYVPGDRSLPARAVPGDGIVPLERLLGTVLEVGYEGSFDLELLGPRIDAEGPLVAAARGAEHLSRLLDRLGA